MNRRWDPGKSVLDSCQSAETHLSRVTATSPMAAKKVQTPLVCHGHERPIVEISFSPVTPDGYFLTSASKDGLPMLRNGQTGDWIGTFQGHKGAVWSCILNDSATIAATASADFSARVWNALSGDEMHKFEEKHIVRTVQFTHQGSKLITAGFEKLVRIYDLQQPDSAPQEITGAKDNIRGACLHPQDNLLLTSYVDRAGIGVWDMRAGKEVRALETPTKVFSIEMQPDGSLFTTSDGNHVRVWDSDKLSEVNTLTFEYEVESASLCPAKGRIAAGGSDLWVHLHDSQSGAELECNKGHHGPVHCVRFAPSGESYASGSEDGTIRIWETDFALKDGPLSTDALANSQSVSAPNGA